MREYETVLVIRPDSSESQIDELLKKVTGAIERNGGSILQQKNWGKKDLAYKIKKYNQGTYYYYDYCGDSGLVAELERILKLHDLPIRYLTVKVFDQVDVETRRKEIALAKDEVKKLEEVAGPYEEAGGQREKAAGDIAGEGVGNEDE